MLFTSTLSQMAQLALYMIIGFTVAKSKVVGADGAKILSKLENTIFIPALILSTFTTQFTVETLSSAWKLLLFSLGVEIIIIPIAILTSKLLSNNLFIRKIYTYGLSFSNFGFMGNAIVLAIYPEYFFYYLIFCIPLWTFIYLWGAPYLLMDREPPINQDGEKIKKSFFSHFKNLLNPMFVSLVVGAVIGLSGLTLPEFITAPMSVCGNCMSPIAMILTGITFAVMDFKKVLSTWSVYAVTVIRLLIIPFIFCGAAWLINKFLIAIDLTFYVCLVASLSMPLGLNTVVIPAAYGKDTSIPAGMALVSHLLSVLTIPLIFTIFL